MPKPAIDSTTDLWVKLEQQAFALIENWPTGSVSAMGINEMVRRRVG
jgi:hypothetical protein